MSCGWMEWGCLAAGVGQGGYRLSELGCRGVPLGPPCRGSRAVGRLEWACECRPEGAGGMGETRIPGVHASFFSSFLFIRSTSTYSPLV